MIRMFQSTALPALEQTAIFTQRRHELLASNLANLDTPDYRAQDLQLDQFQSALAGSLAPAQQRPAGPGVPSLVPGFQPERLMGGGSDGQRRTGVGDITQTSTAGRPGDRDAFASGPRSAMEPIVLHDGSDVSLERQVTELAKNHGLHNLAIATMRSQFGLLRAAITERA